VIYIQRFAILTASRRLY